MFRLIFKTIFLVVILVIITISLAVWKGGEPFRWIGNKIEIVGEAIERFGDRIDKIKKDGEKIVTKLKDTFDFIHGNEQKQIRHEDGTFNKDKRSE